MNVLVLFCCLLQIVSVLATNSGIFKQCGFTVDWRPKWHAQVDKKFQLAQGLGPKVPTDDCKNGYQLSHVLSWENIFLKFFNPDGGLLEKMANDQDDQELHTVMNFVNELFKIDSDAVAPIKKFKDNKKLKTRKNKKNGKKTSKAKSKKTTTKKKGKGKKQNNNNANGKKQKKKANGNKHTTQLVENMKKHNKKGQKNKTHGKKQQNKKANGKKRNQNKKANANAKKQKQNKAGKKQNQKKKTGKKQIDNKPTAQLVEMKQVQEIFRVNILALSPKTLEELNDDMKKEAVVKFNEIKEWYNAKQSQDSAAEFDGQICENLKLFFKLLNSAPANLRYGCGSDNSGIESDTDPMGDVNGILTNKEAGWINAGYDCSTPIKGQRAVKDGNDNWKCRSSTSGYKTPDDMDAGDPASSSVNAIPDDEDAAGSCLKR